MLEAEVPVCQILCVGQLHNLFFLSLLIVAVLARSRLSRVSSSIPATPTPTQQEPPPQSVRSTMALTFPPAPPPRCLLHTKAKEAFHSKRVLIKMQSEEAPGWLGRLRV